MNRHEDSAADAASWDRAIETCASGDLDRVDEERLLALCESEPERWRAVALACIEHRRLTAALQGARRAASQPAGSETPLERRVAQRRTRRVSLRALASTLALVACGMTAGYLMGSSRSATTAVDASRPDGGDPVLASQFAALAQPLLPDAARRVLRDAGVEIREEPVVYLVHGRDGERWAVPEKHLQVRVVGSGLRQP